MSDLLSIGASGVIGLSIGPLGRRRQCRQCRDRRLFAPHGHAASSRSPRSAPIRSRSTASRPAASRRAGAARVGRFPRQRIARVAGRCRPRRNPAALAAQRRDRDRRRRRPAPARRSPPSSPAATTLSADPSGIEPAAAASSARSARRPRRSAPAPMRSPAPRRASPPRRTAVDRGAQRQPQGAGQVNEALRAPRPDRPPPPASPTRATSCSTTFRRRSASTSTLDPRGAATVTLAGSSNVTLVDGNDRRQPGAAQRRPTAACRSI